MTSGMIVDDLNRLMCLKPPGVRKDDTEALLLALFVSFCLSFLARLSHHRALKTSTNTDIEVVGGSLQSSLTGGHRI